MMLLIFILEVPILLLLLLITSIMPGGQTEEAETKHSPTQCGEKRKDLSDEQREKVVKAILEDALLVNDRAYDALVNEGEALYNAAEAANLSDFELQYGSKAWRKAWEHALSGWFDCKAEYSSNGVFHVYGKEV